MFMFSFIRGYIEVMACCSLRIRINIIISPKLSETTQNHIGIIAESLEYKQYNSRILGIDNTVAEPIVGILLESRNLIGIFGISSESLESHRNLWNLIGISGILVESLES